MDIMFLEIMFSELKMQAITDSPAVIVQMWAFKLENVICKQGGNNGKQGLSSHIPWMRFNR